MIHKRKTHLKLKILKIFRVDKNYLNAYISKKRISNICVKVDASDLKMLIKTDFNASLVIFKTLFDQFL